VTAFTSLSMSTVSFGQSVWSRLSNGGLPSKCGKKIDWKRKEKEQESWQCKKKPLKRAKSTCALK
jgi:hypothetical protein